MPLEDEFVDVIGKARNGLELSFEDLSSSTNIDVSLLEDYESGSKKPSSEEVESIAKALNLNPKALINVLNNNYQPEPFDFDQDYDELKIHHIEGDAGGGYKVNAYVVSSNSDCVIVDTGAVPDKIIGLIQEKNLNPKFILVTHGHADHIEGIDKLKDKFNIKSYGINQDENVVESQSIPFGDHEIFVSLTPGHSDDSVTYKFGQFLFVGDLIFAGSLGGGRYSYDKLLESANKVLSLPNNYFIFPGHGPVTSIKKEKENNCFIVK